MHKNGLAVEKFQAQILQKFKCPYFWWWEKGSLGVSDGAGGLSLNFLESLWPDTQFVHVKILILKTSDLAIFYHF